MSLVRLVGSFSRARLDREILEELEAHVQMQVEANVRAGMPPALARRRALIASGGIQQALEQCRDSYSNRWLDRLVAFCDNFVSKWHRAR